MLSRVSRIAPRITSRIQTPISPRGFASVASSYNPPVNPFPNPSPAYELLERVIDASVVSGAVPLSAYSPLLPVEFFQSTISGLEMLLPCGGWSLAITATAILARALIFRVQIWSAAQAIETASATKNAESLTKELDRALKNKDNKSIQKIQEKYRQLGGTGWVARLAGLLGPLIPIPVFVTALYSIRGMASHPFDFPSMATCAPLWLDSLCLPDPLFILPGISAGLFLTNLELNGSMDSENSQARKAVDRFDKEGRLKNLLSDESLGKIKRYGMRGMIIGSMYFTSGFPSACFFFFIPNTFLAIGFGRVMKQAWFRERLGLPKLPGVSVDAQDPIVLFQSRMRTMMEGVRKIRASRPDDLSSRDRTDSTGSSPLKSSRDLALAFSQPSTSLEKEVKRLCAVAETKRIAKAETRKSRFDENRTESDEILEPLPGCFSSHVPARV